MSNTIKLSELRKLSGGENATESALYAFIVADTCWGIGASRDECLMSASQTLSQYILPVAHGDSRESVTWYIRPEEPTDGSLDPHHGDTVFDYDLEGESAQWKALVSECRSRGLVIVFDCFDEDGLRNEWSVRRARDHETPGECIGI